MLDLALYRQVCSMPAIVRDLSIAVADDDDEETLGDRSAASRLIVEGFDGDLTLDHDDTAATG